MARKKLTALTDVPAGPPLKALATEGLALEFQAEIRGAYHVLLLGLVVSDGLDERTDEGETVQRFGNALALATKAYKLALPVVQGIE